MFLFVMTYMLDIHTRVTVRRENGIVLVYECVTDGVSRCYYCKTDTTHFRRVLVQLLRAIPDEEVALSLVLVVCHLSLQQGN